MIPEIWLTWNGLALLIPLLIFAPIYMRTRHKIRGILRLVYYYALVVFLSGLVVIPWAILTLRFRNTKNLSFTFWLWSYLFKLIDLDVEVRNRQNLQRDEPLVLIGNHQSSLDLLWMPWVMPSHCTILAKKELIYAGTLGIGMWLSGLTFVDRTNKKTAKMAVDQQVASMKNDKLKVFIYPEGTRNGGKDILPFKKGAFHLAVQAQVPIVPIVVSSYRFFYKKEDLIFNPVRIIVDVLPALDTEGLTTEDVTDLSDMAREQIKKKYDELNDEMSKKLTRF